MNAQNQMHPMVKKLYKKLPAQARCRKCHRSHPKKDFGVRVMEKDAQGNPLRVARQSWCKRCR